MEVVSEEANSLERVLTDQVYKLFSKKECLRHVDEQTLGTVRLAVLHRAARFLCIPWDPTDTRRVQNRIILSERSFELLDEAWYLVNYTFSDSRISNQEKIARQTIFSHAPYFVETKSLSRYIGILVKKETAYGSNPAAVVPNDDGKSSTEEEGEEGGGGGRGGEGEKNKKQKKNCKKRKNDNKTKSVASVLPNNDQNRSTNEEENKKVVAIRTSSVVTHLKSNVLNVLLAVDGFRGVLPSNYKNYVHHLNDMSNGTEKKHIAAVRVMYDAKCFEEGLHSGTFAVACVFLTLLKLFLNEVGLRMEDFVLSAVNRAVENVSRFIEDNDEDGSFDRKKELGKLRKVYRKQLNDDRILEWIAMEKLKEYGKYACVKYLF